VRISTRRECNAKANIYSLTLHTPHSTLHTYTRSHSLALSHSLSHVRSQSYTHALSLSHVHSRSIHSLTHSLTHIHSRSKKKKLTHPRTLTLNTHTHSLSLSLAHSRPPSSLPTSVLPFGSLLHLCSTHRRVSHRSSALFPSTALTCARSHTNVQHTTQGLFAVQPVGDLAEDLHVHLARSTELCNVCLSAEIRV
jgi:hypothetical protein